MAMPDPDTLSAVQDLLQEVLTAKDRLGPNQACLLILVSIPPVELFESNEAGDPRLLRRIEFPRRLLRRTVEAALGQHPLPAASEELDRVRYYVSFAAGRGIPIGAFVFSKTVHSPIYRGYEDLSFGILNPLELLDSSDADLKDMVRGWLDTGEKWLSNIPPRSVLDAALMTRMRAFFASNRRDGCLGSWASLEALAEASVAGLDWLAPVPRVSFHLKSKEVARAMRGLLARWSPESENAAEAWRKLRNRLIHPFGEPVEEQAIWDACRELLNASGRVLTGILGQVVL